MIAIKKSLTGVRDQTIKNVKFVAHKKSDTWFSNPVSLIFHQYQLPDGAITGIIPYFTVPRLTAILYTYQNRLGEQCRNRDADRIPAAFCVKLGERTYYGHHNA